MPRAGEDDVGTLGENAKIVQGFSESRERRELSPGRRGGTGGLAWRGPRSGSARFRRTPGDHALYQRSSWPECHFIYFRSLVSFGVPTFLARQKMELMCRGARCLTPARRAPTRMKRRPYCADINTNPAPSSSPRKDAPSGAGLEVRPAAARARIVFQIVVSEALR